MRKWVLGVLFIFCGACVFAQSGSRKGNISGTIIDETDKSPVIQAAVQVLSLPDSSMVEGKATDLDGKFTIPVKQGKYVLKVSYLGYVTLFKPFQITAQKPKIDFGNLALSSDAILLQEAVITAQAPEVTASEDTLIYNSSAYRVPEGSALEELVKKLPGAEVDDEGNITINGKTIKKIMIDGKEFFADDPNVAMKNLPVNIIEKVRAYDKESDMARVTGIADGEEETVLDLSVKPGMNKGWLGNIDLAGGTEDRYSGKMMASRFVRENQFTVIGSMNNVNDMGFPGGGGGGRWGRNNGLTARRTAGFNFATKNEYLETGGSVNYNYTNADRVTRQSSETFVSTENSSFQNAFSRAHNRTTNVRADFRLEWTPDTLTTLIFRPRLTYGKTNNTSESNSYTFNEDPGHTTDELLGTEDITTLVPEENIINTIVRRSLSKGDDLTAGGSLMFNRRLGKPGRNITLRGNYNYTNSESEQFSMSTTEYFQLTEAEREDIINRYISTPTSSYNYSLRFTYSEPIFKGGFLQFGYNFQYNRSESDNSTYSMPDNWVIENGDASGNPDAVLDKENSKDAKYDYYNHQVDLSLRWIRKMMQLNVGVSFQPQKTNLEYQKGDYYTDTVRHVFNFTPTLDFRYNFSKTNTLRVTYRGRSSQPSMTDLLPIEDTSDPLNIRQGNPGLKPSFTNTFTAFYNMFNTETQRGLMAHLNFQNQMNNVSNRRTYNEQTGGYITRPENINGNWNLFGMLGTNTALRNKKFTINTNTFANYNNMVSYISNKAETTDSDKNTTKQLRLNERLRGTYRTDWWEFSLNGSLSYMHSRNSYQEQNNMDTYDFSYGASTNIYLPWNMSISTDISQNSRRGYTDNSMNRDELIWNAQISQNFLKGNAATVSIQFYDILKKQSNISRSITAAMRSDTEYNAIYSYCMVHFIYRLNLFGGKAGRMEGGPHRGGGGFGPGPGGPRGMRF